MNEVDDWFKVLTGADLLIKEPLPDRWGEWTFNRGNNTLSHRYYEVDLDQCQTDAECWAWVAQVAGKPWVIHKAFSATGDCLGDLVRALVEIRLDREEDRIIAEHLAHKEAL